MSAPINFESSSIKDEEKRVRREEKRAAQAQYLEKVKNEYEQKKKKKEEAKNRGEDSWMLDSLNLRLEQETDGKKKKKKHKKDKKKKKHKSKDKNSDKSSDDEWVETGGLPEPEMIAVPVNNKPPPPTPVQRDDWLMGGDGFVPTVSRDQLRAKIKADKEEKALDLAGNQKDKSIDEPGQHHLELNPYWKDGGTGLPEEEKQENFVSSDWLRKALQRCEEQAREDGKDLEELATSRWGSLSAIKKMIADADKAERRRKNAGSNDRPHASRDIDSEQKGRRSRSSGRDRKGHRSRSKSRSRSRSRDRRKRRKSSSDNDSENDRYRKRRSRSRSRSQSYRKRSSSRSPKRSRRSRSRSKSPRRRRSRSLDREKSKSSRPKFIKPGEMDSSKPRFQKPGEMNSSKPRFRRPDDDNDDFSRDVTRGRDVRMSSRVPAWKKGRMAEKESESMKNNSVKEHSSHSEDSSSSDSSEEEEEADVQRRPSVPPLTILTESEMNALGAKIVKAELMGDDEKATDLKAQLDAAREARDAAPTPSAPSAGPSSGPSSGPRGQRPEEEVILTRTTKSGMSMPVAERQHEMWGGRKANKKKKVATHGKSGDRERYFADDDKFTLKQMFEREKLGTSEDSNKMFARLAARGLEKTDDDYQMDDAYLKRATQQQSEAQLEEQDRSSAISEHKKMSGALDKCWRCLDKCSKHLIIAIGIKTYVCVPANKSLTDGHCEIVPIQHSSCATQLDEDVWTEIQIFRKGLTRMFSDRDLDVVFMETAMGLHRHPHMVMECLPLPRETGDMAPIYFKKAIQESGTEWDQNKKLVDLSKKDIRQSIPKGFPYFSVDFGLQGGYAHVVEDEQIFPKFFGKEIIGGMLDVEPRIWRKGQRQSFDDQRKKVLELAEWWKPYDWTATITKDGN